MENKIAHQRLMDSKLAQKRRQSGFTMVELGVVVAIAAVILVIALTVVPRVLANNRANAEMQELPSVISNIQKDYSNAPTYNGATLDSVIRLDAFPPERVTVPAAGAATATNRWGGAVTMSVGTISSANDIARVVYAAVPERECKSVIQGVSNLTRRIYVDNANGATAGAGTIVKADGAQLDLTALGTACGSVNSITYDVGK